MWRKKSLCVFQCDSTRTTLGSASGWYNWQLAQPGSASVGPDKEESARRSSSRFSGEVLMLYDFDDRNSAGHDHTALFDTLD